VARRRPAGRQQFSRSDRISEQVREVVANELERIGDERLDLVTITGVRIDNELARAEVFYSAMTAEDEGRIDEVREAFDDVRWPIQQVVNRTVRARRTPQIEFLPDDTLSSALRIEDILAGRVDPSTDDG
jgi:ribosome-binding factor A